jgi:hypothetical protein
MPGCNRKEHEGELEFDYYPDKNIYYNVASSNFIYSLDGAKTWDSLHASSKGDPKSLGRKEKIYSESAEVWKENESHLKMYEGKVYSIITAEDRNFVAVVDEVTDKKTVNKTAIPIRKPSPQPKKKGLKGFFNKVFGKRDRK